LNIYTNRSKIDSRISAVAVCLYIQQTRSAYLRLSTTSIVYIVELYRISLAL
ncbi:hypothetical protein K458DRAFT_288922, partial [Lentithecium fluviatile CBS 122367]